MELIQTWNDNRYCITHYSDTSLLALDLVSRSQECEKANTSTPVISQSFQSSWMEFGILLRLVGVGNLILVLSCPVNIQGREPYIYDCVKNNFKRWLVFRHLQTDVFKLGGIIESILLYGFTSVWMTLIFIQGHSCIRNQKLWCPFLWQI